jgi:hypothetical protein
VDESTSSETRAATPPVPDQPDGSGSSASVQGLGPGSTGRWLVRSRGSEHLFDLDAGTYSRRPGAGHGRFRHDGHVVRLTRVERWPKVGERFFIWVDDHEQPAAVEHWHQSSPIVSITAVPANNPAGTSSVGALAYPGRVGDHLLESLLRDADGAPETVYLTPSQTTPDGWLVTSLDVGSWRPLTVGDRLVALDRTSADEFLVEVDAVEVLGAGGEVMYALRWLSDLDPAAEPDLDSTRTWLARP